VGKPGNGAGHIGVGSNSTRHTIENAKRAKKLGADAVSS
jgi:dihydrodipicolinate synthase/N-acetylneuraminate lyase